MKDMTELLKKENLTDADIKALWAGLNKLSSDFGKGSSKDHLELALLCFEKLEKSTKLTLSQKAQIKILKKIGPLARRFLK